MRISMIGTRGVPARYGGFETAVDEIGRRLVARGHEVVVYCRGDKEPRTYQGMQRIVLPAVKHPAAETLSHSALSVAHLLAHRTDAAIVFNAANAVLLPVIKAARIPVAVHVDGLEWKRAKWGPNGRRWYLWGERLAVRWGDELIADAAGIQDYYTQRYGVATRLLTYGAPILASVDRGKLAELGLEWRGYHLVVARLEPENHVDVILEGYRASNASLPLVVVGSVPYASEHERQLHAIAAGDPRIRMIGGVWDQELLDALYAGSASYLHGHSVGGTNPSLLRAMGAGATSIAWDVNFNHEVLGGPGRYFPDAAVLSKLVEEVEAHPDAARERGEAARARAADVYRWDEVAAGYEQLCADLVARRRGGVVLDQAPPRHTPAEPVASPQPGTGPLELLTRPRAAAAEEALSGERIERRVEPSGEAVAERRIERRVERRGERRVERQTERRIERRVERGADEQVAADVHGQTREP